MGGVYALSLLLQLEQLVVLVLLVNVHQPHPFEVVIKCEARWCLLIC